MIYASLYLDDSVQALPRFNVYSLCTPCRFSLGNRLILIRISQIVPQQAQNLSITKTQLTRVHACTSPSSPSWLAAFLLLKMAVLCYGLFLSWQTRAVALPSMNDSRCIVVSSMTTIVVTTVAVSVSQLLQQHPNAVYASVVMSVWICTMVALCMAFVPKVRGG